MYLLSNVGYLYFALYLNIVNKIKMLRTAHSTYIKPTIEEYDNMNVELDALQEQIIKVSTIL
jgi:hypothetical protein